MSDVLYLPLVCIMCKQEFTCLSIQFLFFPNLKTKSIEQLKLVWTFHRAIVTGMQTVILKG